MSSVFSRKITISTSCGFFTGDGTPVYHFTGRCVDTPNPAPNRRRQWPLDPYQVLLECISRVVMKPGVLAIDLVAFLACVDLEPLDLPLTAVGLLHSRVK